MQDYPRDLLGKRKLCDKDMAAYVVLFLSLIGKIYKNVFLLVADRNLLQMAGELHFSSLRIVATVILQNSTWTKLA